MTFSRIASRTVCLVRAAVLVFVAATFDAPAQEVSAPVVDTNAVRPEVWTTNFPEALARARSEHRPLIIRGGLTGCGGCVRMMKHLDDRVFARWVKDTGIYLASFHTDKAKSSPEQAAAMNFLLESKFLSPKNIPYVGVYWPRVSNDEIRVGFCFQREHMPGAEAHSSLAVEFIRAMEFQLADYLKTCGSRPTEDEILAETKKRIVAAGEGPGTVAIEPSDGMLVCGKSVKISATPQPGCRVTGWKGPDGKILRGKKNKALTITYLLEEGTYTAVFDKH